jgi:hypothetical protein
LLSLLLAWYPAGVDDDVVHGERGGVLDEHVDVPFR